ncbi:MAG: metallophosphoesterase family protein [Planctomycetaceae bacterium]|nr:metallophosphoesterase family protein [Planctomycetaceae bacterium]MBV8558219.1 metallophosphoesterase family protein [Planctomycetaceae bacterium]MBV8677035.1 metallophosphoesterase family protein [Planctomycetaceae bacterium]
MKLGLISDVHGDPLALELAWAHLTTLAADTIVCAGDVVGYGPFPDRVVAFLKEHAIDCVRGNHDRWALERGPGEPDEFGGGTPSAETLEFLERLPFYRLIADGPQIAVIVHGSPRSDMEFVTRASHPPAVLRGLLGTLGADLLVVGHTHEPMWFRCESGLVVNPGSTVSMPVVQTSRTFALVDLPSLTVTFHDVESGAEVPLEPWPDRAETTG